MTTRAQFVSELPEDHFPQPGTYVAASTDQAFGVLLAMVAAGDAVLLGERWEAGGPTGSTKLVAVEVGGTEAYRPNGYLLDVVPVGYQQNARKIQVKAGKRFFANALKDYGSDWCEKWWREAIQNAVDAGARNVECLVEQQEDGNFLVSVIDDGRGMDPYTVEHKFLVLGETTKEGGGTTGGFGKAKELLLLPWLGWEVHSRETVARGVGDEGEIDTVEYLNGTRLSVLMPNDKHTRVSDAIGFIRKCTLPGVRFKVNGERVSADLSVRQQVLDIDGKVAVYYDDKNTNYPYEFLVRTGGLFMFGESIWKKPAGLVVVELIRPSTELLTANRDSFADWELRGKLNAFAQRLAVEKEEAVRVKEKRLRQKFRGTGSFEAAPSERKQAAMLERLGPLEPDGRAMRGGSKELSGDQVAALIEVLGTMDPYAGAGTLTETVYTDEGGRPFGAGERLVATSSMAEAMLKGLAVTGPSHIQTIVKQLAWEPDFYLVNEVAGWNVAKKFYPETMTADVRKLARLWAEMCRFVLICLNCPTTFGVGFIFDKTRRAEYRPEDDEHWLMLNPFDNADPHSGKIWKLDEAGMAEVYASAVHECTHMANNTSDHDIDFAAALTENIAKLFGKERQVRALKGMVLAAEKETTERLRAMREAAGAPKRGRPRKEESTGRRGEAEVIFGPPPGGEEDGETIYWSRKIYGPSANQWTLTIPDSPVGGGDVYELAQMLDADKVAIVRLPHTEEGVLEQMRLTTRERELVAAEGGIHVSTLESEAERDSRMARAGVLEWIVQALQWEPEQVALRSGEPLYRVPATYWASRW